MSASSVPCRRSVAGGMDQGSARGAVPLTTIQWRASADGRIRWRRVAGGDAEVGTEQRMAWCTAYPGIEHRIACGVVHGVPRNRAPDCVWTGARRTPESSTGSRMAWCTAYPGIEHRIACGVVREVAHGTPSIRTLLRQRVGDHAYPSFLSQLHGSTSIHLHGQQWIDARRPARRHHAGSQRDEPDRQRDDSEGDRVGRRHPVEQRRGDPREPERRD